MAPFDLKATNRPYRHKAGKWLHATISMGFKEGVSYNSCLDTDGSLVTVGNSVMALRKDSFYTILLPGADLKIPVPKITRDPEGHLWICKLAGRILQLGRQADGHYLITDSLTTGPGWVAGSIEFDLAGNLGWPGTGNSTFTCVPAPVIILQFTSW